MQAQSFYNSNQNTVTCLKKYDEIKHGEAIMQLCLLLCIGLKYPFNDRLLCEHKYQYQYHQAHAVYVANFGVADSFFMFALSDVVADHSGNGVGEAEGEHEGEGEEAEDGHVA